jgi:hypothetical protein
MIGGAGEIVRNVALTPLAAITPGAPLMIADFGAKADALSVLPNRWGFGSRELGDQGWPLVDLRSRPIAH